MKRILSLSMFVLAVVHLHAADEVRVILGDVTDNRTTGKFFAALKIELKVLGGVVDDASGLKEEVKTAVDDTGRSLLKEKEKTFKEHGFQKPVGFSGGPAAVTIELRNPSRKAAVIKEISGIVKIYVPKNDPDATVTVADFSEQSGKPIASPVLTAAKIEVIPLTKAGYDALKASSKESGKRKPKKPKDAAEKADAAAGAVGGALEDALGEMFSGFMRVGENSIALIVTDPDSKLVDVEFEDAAGKEIEQNGRMSSGNEKKTVVYEFRRKVPPKMQMKLHVLTPKACVNVPFKLVDVPLP